MATNKNITMKEFNGTDYDILYPKTIASQIPDVYSKSETYPASQLYTQNQLYTKTQIDRFINNLQTQVNGRAKIQVGSYVGTGTYGENNPCVLTFKKEPIVFGIIGCWNKQYNKCLMIPNIFNTKQVKESTFDGWAFNWLHGSGDFGNLSISNTVDGYGQLSINNNVAKWWWDGFVRDASEIQLNYKDNIYYWFAMF